MSARHPTPRRAASTTGSDTPESFSMRHLPTTFSALLLLSGSNPVRVRATLPVGTAPPAGWNAAPAVLRMRDGPASRGVQLFQRRSLSLLGARRPGGSRRDLMAETNTQDWWYRERQRFLKRILL